MHDVSRETGCLGQKYISCGSSSETGGGWTCVPGCSVVYGPDGGALDAQNTQELEVIVEFFERH